MWIINFLGATAIACFSLCGVPAAWRSYRAGNAGVIPVSTPALISFGALGMYIYLLGTYGWNFLLFIGYLVEFISWIVVLYFRLWPRSHSV